MKQIVLKTVVKKAIRQHGMVLDKALEPIIGKKVTVTIDVDEGTEVTTTVPAPTKPMVVA
jgi:hypothetical protein